MENEGACDLEGKKASCCKQGGRKLGFFFFLAVGIDPLCNIWNEPLILFQCCNDKDAYTKEED